MKPEDLKEIRESVNFTQKKISEVLGMSENSFHCMENGTRPIPDYIRNSALTVPLLNYNKLLRKHAANIGVELPKEEKED